MLLAGDGGWVFCCCCASLDAPAGLDLVLDWVPGGCKPVVGRCAVAARPRWPVLRCAVAVRCGSCCMMDSLSDESLAPGCSAEF